MTFQQVSDQWLSVHKLRIGNSTYLGYKNDLRHIFSFIGDKDIKNVKYTDLQLIINHKINENYSKRTIHGFNNTLSQVFDFALKAGYIKENITNMIDIPHNLPKPKSRGCLTTQELDLVLNFPHKYRDFVLFIYYTGIRRGEAIALKWSDIDWENNYVRINKSVEFINNQPRVKRPKTENGDRVIPIPYAFMPYLRIMRSRSKTDYIFTQITTGKPHTESSYKKMWDRWFNDLNASLGGTKEYRVIRRFTAHMLRHTYITFLFENKVPDLIIQNVAGHADITFTRKQYTHIREEMERLSFANIRTIF